ETWTERNSGCYPPPPGVTGPYLVPGYRLLLQYEDVFYEYNADQGGATGELCAETLQLVPVEPALEIVTANPTAPASPDFDTVHILCSEEDVVEFNSNNPDIATVAVNQIDWDIEVLVGGWVDIGPATEVVRAYQSPADPTGTLIAIEIATVNPEDLPEQPEPAPSQAWVLVDITRPDSTYEFVVQNGN
ncbi:MAG: hypothetical protein QF357_08505, partial [Dehalococcoidia bacterium]|nr:hypothetical protein [Dehalococcoidia bacterium]